MMMKKALSLVLLTLIAAAAQAQAPDSRPEGRTYELGSFDRLELDGSAKVRLSQGERDQVFIAGDDAVQKNVEIELSNGLLRIHPSGGWKFWNNSRLQVDVQMRRLSQLTLSGASDLYATGPIKTEKLSISISGAGLARFDELAAGVLRLDISGAGDAQLAGSADELGVSVSGKGKILAEQLRAGRATVSISGVGNANLWVTESLRVSISGIGNVDYWGQPQQVRRSTSGLGSINARGDKR
jgi:hypothetical protein